MRPTAGPRTHPATDPGGSALELFHGPIHDHELFVSPAGVTGFVTGAHGMGPIVLGSPELAQSVAFYTGVLGFRVSDSWRPTGPVSRDSPGGSSIGTGAAAST